MKQTKFRYFSVLLVDGSEVEIKAPQSPITEDYCKRLAPHYANKQKGLNLAASDIARVKGMPRP